MNPTLHRFCAKGAGNFRPKINSKRSAWQRIRRHLKLKLFFILAKYFPQNHCRLVTKEGAKYETPFSVDIKNPKYFNEKLLWLKYYVYNASPLVAHCYDKFLVRDYVRKHGCGETLNTLYGVWDSVDDIPWEELPKDCVLKVSNGSLQHVFKRSGETFDIEKARTTLTAAFNRSKYIYPGDLFALVNPQRIICERLIGAPSGRQAPDDYKFYCFHGEPKFLLYIWDRFEEGGMKETFKEVGLRDCSSFFDGATNITLEKPECYEQMLESAKCLSQDFPFVRVDFYVEGGKPIFGELTFTPAGSYVLYHVNSIEGLEKMGNMIELGSKKNYRKLRRDKPC